MHTSTNGISNEMLQNLHKLAYSHRIIEFKEIFSSLNHHNKQCYCKIITTQGRASSMFGVLNAIKEDQAASMFYDLLKKNKEFAFRTLDATFSNSTLFNTLFNRLSQYQEEYIKYVIEKKEKSSFTMSYVLNAMTKDQAVNMFYDLLKENQGFALNILDEVFHQSYSIFNTTLGRPDPKKRHLKYRSQKQRGLSFAFCAAGVTFFKVNTLFDTLLNQLNSQQKKDYRIHLVKKGSFGTRAILEEFYSNNKDNSSKLRTENLNKESLGSGSLVQKRKRSDLDEFSALNPASFFSSSTLEEMIDKCELDPRDLVPAEFTFVKGIHIEPAAKRQRTSANSLPDYSKKTAYQFSSIVMGET